MERKRPFNRRTQVAWKHFNGVVCIRRHDHGHIVNRGNSAELVYHLLTSSQTASSMALVSTAKATMRFRSASGVRSARRAKSREREPGVAAAAPPKTARTASHVTAWRDFAFQPSLVRALTVNNDHARPFSTANYGFAA